MGNEITLDWDLKFHKIYGSYNFKVLKLFVNDNRAKVKLVAIRRSSNGNSHVKIVFIDRIQVSDYDKFKIRAFLKDDNARVILDLNAALINNPGIFDLSRIEGRNPSSTPAGRLWDWKIVDGKAHDSGPWEEVLV